MITSKEAKKMIRKAHMNFDSPLGEINCAVDKVYDDFEKEKSCKGCVKEPIHEKNYPLECCECSRWYADGYTEPLQIFVKTFEEST